MGEKITMHGLDNENQIFFYEQEFYPRLCMTDVARPLRVNALFDTGVSLLIHFFYGYNKEKDKYKCIKAG